MKVVCLIDESEAAINALRFYLKGMHQADNEVHLFHAVIPPHLPIVSLTELKVPVEQITDIMNKHNQKQKDLEITCTNLGQEFSAKFIYKWEIVEKVKNIGDEAMKYIEEVKADLVVCGTRNLGRASKVILGSVSEHVLKRTTCPVMIHKS